MKERKREKEGSAREIARLPTEMEGGVRAVTMSFEFS
jgi:hypothetical protein